jgi:hypothetical protein
MEQLMALGIVLGDLDSTAKAFTDMKDELVKEKATQEIEQVEINILTQVVESLKILVDKFSTQIPSLE